MNINATLVVQAFNFFIAYLILRFLLLKPAIAEVRQEEHHEQLLSDGIELAKKNAAHKQAEREALWAACQDHFKKQSPAPVSAQEAILRNITPDIVPEPLDDMQLKKTADTTAQMIVARFGGFND